MTVSGSKLALIVHVQWAQPRLTRNARKFCRTSRRIVIRGFPEMWCFNDIKRASSPTVLYLLSLLCLTSFQPLIHARACTSRDISVSQSRDSTPGIPQFIVQITNTCTSGCTPSDIHLNCGWFASAGTINPKVFRRVSYNDCVVNGGGPLPREAIVRFTYRNSFMYPLSFKSAKFC